MNKKRKKTVSLMLISLAFIVIVGSAVIGVYGGKMTNTPCAKECAKLCTSDSYLLKSDIAELSAGDCKSQCLQARCNQNVGKCDAYMEDDCCNLFAPLGQDPDCAPITRCNDGIDNDGDGKIDVADPGCTDASDITEATDRCTDSDGGFDPFKAGTCTDLDGGVITDKCELGSFGEWRVAEAHCEPQGICTFSQIQCQNVAGGQNACSEGACLP